MARPIGETVSEWRIRKRMQGLRAIERHPGFRLEEWQDYGTRFVLVRSEPVRAALVFGSLPGPGGPGVDLPDYQIDAVFVTAEVPCTHLS